MSITDSIPLHFEEPYDFFSQGLQPAYIYMVMRPYILRSRTKIVGVPSVYSSEYVDLIRRAAPHVYGAHAHPWIPNHGQIGKTDKGFADLNILTHCPKGWTLHEFADLISCCASTSPWIMPSIYVGRKAGPHEEVFMRQGLHHFVQRWYSF